MTLKILRDFHCSNDFWKCEFPAEYKQTIFYNSQRFSLFKCRLEVGPCYRLWDYANKSMSHNPSGCETYIMFLQILSLECVNVLNTEKDVSYTIKLGDPAGWKFNHSHCSANKFNLIAQPKPKQSKAEGLASTINLRLSLYSFPLSLYSLYSLYSLSLSTQVISLFSQSQDNSCRLNLCSAKVKQRHKTKLKQNNENKWRTKQN